MTIDRIKFYIECENMNVDICLDGGCPYEWLCCVINSDDWTQMFYSEGE